MSSGRNGGHLEKLAWRQNAVRRAHRCARNGWNARKLGLRLGAPASGVIGRRHLCARELGAEVLLGQQDLRVALVERRLV